MEKVDLVGLVEVVLLNNTIEVFEFDGMKVQVVDFMEDDKVVVFLLDDETEVYIDYDVVCGNVLVERTFVEVMKDED
jgi:hypothetical protein